MFFQELCSVNFYMQVFAFFYQFFCIVDIVISRKGECSEGLGTSFISDMRSEKTRSSTRFFSVMFLFLRTKFTVMSVY